MSTAAAATTMTAAIRQQRRHRHHHHHHHQNRRRLSLRHVGVLVIAVVVTLFSTLLLVALPVVYGQVEKKKKNQRKKQRSFFGFPFGKRSDIDDDDYILQGEINKKNIKKKRNNKTKSSKEDEENEKKKKQEEQCFCWRVQMSLPFVVLLILQVGEHLQKTEEADTTAASATATAISASATTASSSSKRTRFAQEDELAMLPSPSASSTDRTTHQIHTIDLAFDSIKLTLQTKKNGSKPRLILDGSIRGRARPGRLLAIMGPSGAGKSTVLHALAGRINDVNVNSQKLQLQGNRYVNGHAVPGNAMIPSQALIEQDVNFFPHMTVRETLDFRVHLQFGSSSMTKSQRDGLVQDLLHQLGLIMVQDSIVGGPSVRGISGGERKRLSIAVEMITNPSLLFLDEPTTGLDSTAATALIQTLHELATTQNKTIVAVIHQPSQHVFGLFDDLLLVSQGKQMYFGPVNKVRHYMEVDMGFPAPLAGMGTAEHVLDCISNQPNSPDETMDQVEQRIQKIHQAANLATIDFGMIMAATGSGNGNDKNGFVAMINSQGGRRRPRSNILVQFRLLLQRSLREILRGKTALMVNIVQQISIALIYGGIYNMRSNNQGSIQDRFGLLSLITIGSAQLALATTVKSFPREKEIVSKEMGAATLYGTFPYFIGKALSEWPFVALMNGLFGVLVSRFTGLSKGPGKMLRFIGLLTTHGLLSQSNGLAIGAISPSIDIALALMPVVSILTFIFDGRNVSQESTPWCLKWIPRVSLMRWGYEGFCLNEFEGLEFTSPNLKERLLIPKGPIMKTGADALAQLGMDATQTSIGTVVRAQLLITGACWLLSYIGLSATRQRFLVMDSPSPQEVLAQQQEQEPKVQ